MRKTVADVMSEDFITVTADVFLEDALARLIEAESTELCVVDDRGRFEGVVTDFDLLKASLNGELSHRRVDSYVSRAITVLAADATVEQVVPIFRDGSCSRAYICHDGRLLGRLSRMSVLMHLAGKNQTASAPDSACRMQLVYPALDQLSVIQGREHSPRAPQFLSNSITSVLGALSVDRSPVTSHPSV